jgi:Protein of unknown function (DUF2012)
MILHHLVLLASLLSFAFGIDIRGSISSSEHLPALAVLAPSTLILLSAPGIQYKTHPSPSGTFTYRNVTAGPSYLFEIDSITHIFPPLRIDTTNGQVEVYQTFKGNEWSCRGARLSYPIEITSTAKADYYIVSNNPLINLIIAAFRIQSRCAI